MTTRISTLPTRLRPDCGACSGLCCVAPAFDTAQGFGFDKPAHTPCVNLRPDFRCAIHDRLAERGFSGCVAFDCYGAGQRISREMFHGAKWSDSARVARKMFHAFKHLCILHELMALLTIALQWVDDDTLKARLGARLMEIDALCQEQTATEVQADVAIIKQHTMALLRELESTSIGASLELEIEKSAQREFL